MNILRKFVHQVGSIYKIFIFSVSPCLGFTFVSANKNFDMPRVCIKFVEPL